MYRRFIHYSLILGVTCALAACGFQLRGVGSAATSLPDNWKSMALVTNSPNSEFSRDVIALLSANGVQWTERGKANFNLVLAGEHFEQRYLSLNSEARVAEYELTMSSQFSVLDANNQEVVAPTSVSVIKQVENNPRNVVGKEGEVQMVQNDMRIDLAQQIMRRLSFYAAAGGSPKSENEPENEPEVEPEDEFPLQ